MKAEKQNLFPVPLYQFSLQDHALLNVYLKSRLYSCRQKHRQGLAGGIGGNMGTWQSTGAIQEQQEYQLFSNQLHQCIEQVSRECSDSDKFWCSAMRASISDRYGSEEFDVDQNSIWQGIYFVQTPVDDGNVAFKNPRIYGKENLVSTSASKDKNSENTERLEEAVFTPVAGTAFIFPSWLKYRVTPNRSLLRGEDGERISVRFAFSRAIATTGLQ